MSLRIALIAATLAGCSPGPDLPHPAAPEDASDGSDTGDTGSGADTGDTADTAAS